MLPVSELCQCFQFPAVMGLWWPPLLSTTLTSPGHEVMTPELCWCVYSPKGSMVVSLRGCWITLQPQEKHIQPKWDKKNHRINLEMFCVMATQTVTTHLWGFRSLIYMGAYPEMASWGEGNVFSGIRSDFNCFYTCALKSNPHFIIITKPLPSFKKSAKTTLRAVSFLNKTHYYFFRQAVNGVFPYFSKKNKKLNMTFAGGLEGAVQTWLRPLPFHWLIPIRPHRA